MDAQVAAVASAMAGGFTLVGTIFTVVYRNRKPRKDRVELFFERYDKDRETDRKDIKDLRDRVESVEKENVALKKDLDKAIRSLDDKDEMIRKLQKEVNTWESKYKALLKKFKEIKSHNEGEEK